MDILPILPYEYDPQLGDQMEVDETDPGIVINEIDARFESNFEVAKKLLIPPQSIREKLTLDDVVMAYLALIEMWMNSTPGAIDVIAKAIRNFAAFVCSKPPYGFDEYSEEVLEHIYDQVRLQWSTVINWLNNNDLIAFNERVTTLTQMQPKYPDPSVAMNIIAHMSFLARQILYHEQQLEALGKNTAMSQLTDGINWGKFSSRNNHNLTRHQRCQMLLLRKIENLKLRKFQREIYQQIITPKESWEENGEEHHEGQYYTHAWKHWMSINEFVASAVSKDDDFETWKDLTSGPSINPLCEKLAILKDNDFPDLAKDRHYFSYKDGIYHVTYDDFYAYNVETTPEVRAKIAQLDKMRKDLREANRARNNMRSFSKIEGMVNAINELHAQTRTRGSDMLPASLVSSNFTDLYFIPTQFEGSFEEYASECSRWDSIHTPNFDRILDHQDFYDKNGGALECSQFKCGRRAQYSVPADTRPRWCEGCKSEGMIDKLIVRCNIPKCNQQAAMWQTKEQASANGTERQKYCKDHAKDDSEPIPEAILSGGNANGDVPLEPESKHSVNNIFFSLVGRLFYDVGEFDNFQVIPFLKGLANTGKSTVIKILQSFYDPQDVQVLSNNVERRFGLEPLMQKFLYVAPEVKDNFGLDQAEFQSMVSGDPMSISRKFKLAITMTWTVPGILAGNTPPKWADKSGSIARRVVNFPFDRPVRVTDSELEGECKKELPYIQRKANLAYHALVKYLQKQENKSIWSLMPQKLLRAKRDLHMSCSSLGHFVKENGEVVVDEGDNRMISYVPWEFFLEKLHAFNVRMRQPVFGQLEIKEFIEFFATLNVDVVFSENEHGQPNQRTWDKNEKTYKSPFLHGMTYRPNVEG